MGYEGTGDHARVSPPYRSVGLLPYLGAKAGSDRRSYIGGTSKAGHGHGGDMGKGPAGARV